MKIQKIVLSLLTALSLTGGLAAQNVVTEWNAIASTAIVKNGGKGSGAASVWFAYESIAVYDAVNSIHRRFKPFYYDGRSPRYASDEAAVIAAAHRILVHYFPAQQIAFDALYKTSLESLSVSPHVKEA